jgi:long-subunit acyl-CoA synthetase (AMP-forming)
MSKIIKKINSFLLSNPDKIALSDGFDLQISYANLSKEINKISQILQKYNLQSLAILAENSPAWIAFDLACLNSEITNTPIPHFFSEKQIENLITESSLQAVLIDAESSLAALQSKKKQSISLTIFNKEFQLIFLENQSKPKLNKIAKITFTSGSTSNAKGVCLTQENLENVVFSLVKNLESENLQANLSVLPLAVLLENIAGVYVSLVLGAASIIPPLSEVGISNSSSLNLEKFCQIINQTKPESIILVPELAKVLIALVSAQKINNSNFKFIALGGAKIANDLLIAAQKLNLPIYQGYGLSEVASVVSLNNKNSNKTGSVGKILPHLEVKIATDGEILVKGNLAKSYSNLENFSVDGNGFYKTGDVGRIDEDGFLFIDGRKKDIFITSFGRNVSPAWVESELLKSQIILQACVFGEAMPKNVAIITSNCDLKAVESEVAKINSNLPDYAQIGKIILTKEPFSLQNNMLTGNGRIRRSTIFNFYQQQIINT